MALVIDTKHLQVIIRDYEEFNNKHAARSGRSFKVHRVFVYGIVTHDAASRAQFDDDCGYYLAPDQQEALDRQAKQGDDETEEDVWRNLKQLAATTRKRGANSAVEFRAGTTILFASAQSPTSTSCTQDRSPFSFRRYAYRLIQEKIFKRCCTTHHRNTHSRKVFPTIHSGGCFLGVPKIDSAVDEALYHSVIWFVQFDFFDLSSQSTYSASSPREGRQTGDPCHDLSPRRDEDNTARPQNRSSPKASRFRGVCYRKDHKRYVAQMKPPKSKTNVKFGEFHKEIDAARVVDVAFYHYGRQLNFPDFTRWILSSLPPIPGGLSPEAMLKLVRRRTKWMKSKLSLLPAPVNNSGLPSELILDEADNAVSQPQPYWLQSSMSDIGMAEEGQETCGVADGSMFPMPWNPGAFQMEASDVYLELHTWSDVNELLRSFEA